MFLNLFREFHSSLTRFVANYKRDYSDYTSIEAERSSIEKLEVIIGELDAFIRSSGRTQPPHGELTLVRYDEWVQRFESVRPPQKRFVEASEGWFLSKTIKQTEVESNLFRVMTSQAATFRDMKTTAIADNEREQARLARERAQVEEQARSKDLELALEKKRKAEAETKRLEAEEARKKTEAKAAKEKAKADEAARKQADKEARRKADAEEAQRKAEAEAAQRKAELDRIQQSFQEQRKADAEAAQRKADADAAQRKAELDQLKEQMETARKEREQERSQALVVRQEELTAARREGEQAGEARLLEQLQLLARTDRNALLRRMGIEPTEAAATVARASSGSSSGNGSGPEGTAKKLLGEQRFEAVKLLRVFHDSSKSDFERRTARLLILLLAVNRHVIIEEAVLRLERIFLAEFGHTAESMYKRWSPELIQCLGSVKALSAAEQISGKLLQKADATTLQSLYDAKQFFPEDNTARMYLPQLCAEFDKIQNDQEMIGSLKKGYVDNFVQKCRALVPQERVLAAAPAPAPAAAQSNGNGGGAPRLDQ